MYILPITTVNEADLTVTSNDRQSFMIPSQIQSERRASALYDDFSLSHGTMFVDVPRTWCTPAPHTVIGPGVALQSLLIPSGSVSQYTIQYIRSQIR